jgi:ethanolamine utilization protein EutP (predicted NTPase)
MIIDIEDIQGILLSKKISIKGCFHVGSHDCEELTNYNMLGVKTEDIVWVDALSFKVYQSVSRGIPNVYHALITDKDDEDTLFNVANNLRSSSILEFGTEFGTEFGQPRIAFIDKIHINSITIDTFFERNNLDASKYDFWNLKIKGAELLALKGATQSIKHAKVLYIEVSSKELYKDGALIRDIDEYLGQFNFKRVMTNITIHKWGDALYILDF